jgi:hypothetical protein
MKIKDTNIYLIRLESVFEKKTMVKSVIYLLFSYHTGYIMCIPGLGYIFKRFFFLLEAFWLDVTTSKDECTWTRLTSVVFTRKRPFTEEYQLLAHGRWFSPGTPASSTTKTGRHDIAEILLKVALSTKINQSTYYCYVDVDVVVHFCVFLSGRESLECLYLF